MFRIAALVSIALALHAPGVAQQDAVRPTTEYPVVFELQLGVAQAEDGWTMARLEGNAVHFGVLIASLDAETIRFPGLPSILANPVILGCGVMASSYSFTLGRIPAGFQVNLQGLALSLDNQIAASLVQKVAG